MVRFLKLVEPALQILPEVAMPERKVRKGRRLQPLTLKKASALHVQ